MSPLHGPPPKLVDSCSYVSQDLLHSWIVKFLGQHSSIAQEDTVVPADNCKQLTPLPDQLQYTCGCFGMVGKPVGSAWATPQSQIAPIATARLNICWRIQICHRLFVVVMICTVCMQPDVKPYLRLSCWSVQYMQNQWANRSTSLTTAERNHCKHTCTVMLNVPQPAMPAS